MSVTAADISADPAIDTDALLRGLGGAHNLLSAQGCMTRIRCLVADPTQVDKEQLKAAGALSVITVGESLQVVVGPQADAIAEALSAHL